MSTALALVSLLGLPIGLYLFIWPEHEAKLVAERYADSEATDADVSRQRVILYRLGGVMLLVLGVQYGALPLLG